MKAFIIASALFGSAFGFQVDSARVDADYRAGEFEKVEAALRPIFKAGAAASRRDSVLAWKYLAVVYAANPVTREKGRYCMLRMLEADPAADLLDLFVGEQVDAVFVKTRREQQFAEAALPAREPAPAPAAVPAPVVPADEEADSARAPTGHGTKKFLVTALAAAAVAGLSWYSWENSPPRAKAAP